MNHKFVKAVLAGALLAGMSSYAVAHNDLSCSTKREALQKQLDYAKAHNNTYRVAGLETAISDVELNCSNSRLEEKYLEKVADKKRKVVEREADLAKARVDGRAEKIAKKERKLREAQAELKEAEANLQRYHEMNNSK